MQLEKVGNEGAKKSGGTNVPPDIYRQLLLELNEAQGRSAHLESRAEALQQRIAMLQNDLSKLEARSNDTRRSGEAVSTLTRDINHALKTPLSRLDATSRLLEGGTLDTKEAASRIANATKVCYYFLNAFRSLTFETVSGSQGEKFDFKRSLEDAIELYTGWSDKELNVVVDVPDTISSAPPYYVMAALMPLIENAVEAAPVNSQLSISGRETPAGLQMEVQNKYQHQLPQDFQRRGVSGREGDKNEGLGISIARNFLQSLSVGTLDYKIIERESRVLATMVMKNK